MLALRDAAQDAAARPMCRSRDPKDLRSGHPGWYSSEKCLHTSTKRQPTWMQILRGYTKRDAALCLRMQAFIIKIRVSLKEMQHWRSHDHLLLKCEAAPERRIREMPPSSEELRNRDIRTVVQESPLALVLGIQGHSITETCDEIQLEIPP